MEQSGYLLLADISGYTEFVTQTEIDHGTEIMESLIGVVIEETRRPFRVQEIEGDAVFAWSPGADLDRGVLAVEMVEGIYLRFRSALDDIRRNSTCPCRACACAGDLDMKFILHYGSFARRSVAGHEGISGPDVILTHRLLKNSIRETTGCAAYAFFTEPAVRALGIEGMTAEMTRHEEGYEHLGNVAGHVYDIGEYWEQVQSRRSVTVPTENAFMTVSTVVPVSRTDAWEYYTNPLYRQRWLAADSLTLELNRGGRYSAGTVEHCIHGRKSSVLRTLDWKPMRYVTQSFGMPFNGYVPYTAWFEEAGEDETHLTLIFGRVTHDRPVGRGMMGLMMVFMASRLRKELQGCADRLLTVIREESGKRMMNAE